MLHDPHLGRLFKVCYCLAAVLVFGTLGYLWIEGWCISDSFYMTVITVATVGYGEAQPLSPVGRLFTMLLIFLSVISMTCFSAVLTSFIVEKDLGGHYAKRRILKMISQLKNHTIVCGAGMMGQVVIERLMEKRQPVVLIDSDPKKLELLKGRYRRLLTVEGSPTSELSLAEANVLEAKHVVAALDSEIDNLLIAITCKDLGNDIAVYALSNDITIGNRMRKAEVDQVISPCQISGNRVADLILA